MDIKLDKNIHNFSAFPTPLLAFIEVESQQNKALECQIVGINNRRLRVQFVADSLKLESELGNCKIKTQYGNIGSVSMNGEIIHHSAGATIIQTSDDVSHTILTQIMNHYRKNQHIHICADKDIESKAKFTGFERYSLLPCAFPEGKFADVNTQTTFLGSSFSAPFLITGMTGGTENGTQINENLGYAASKLGIPMGVGSQRIAIEDASLSSIFRVKDKYPDLFLIGNLGGAQLLDKNYLNLAQNAVEMIHANGLAIHMNVLQELIQEEGDRDFSNILMRLEELVNKVNAPIIVKEVGCGISPQIAKKLFDAGVAAIDVGGLGGTSWAYIEGQRSISRETQQVAETFRDWGIPTAYALTESKKVLPPTYPLIATGGMRSGLMAAKAIGLGACLVGFGLPLFKAALQSGDAVYDQLAIYLRELKIAMFASGCHKLDDLPEKICSGYPLETNCNIE